MNLDETLDALATDPDHSIGLAELALHLSVDEYPDLDVTAYLDRIAAWSDRLRPRLIGRAAEDVIQLTQLLFFEERFAGNTKKYYDPRNSYLNDVMDRKLGIPISLAVLAIAVGTGAGLNVVGVGLPGHFIAKLIGRDGIEVLFDPFNGGKVLDLKSM